MKTYFTRMGDASVTFMAEDEIRNDISDAVALAAKKGKIPPLTQEDMDHLFEIITMPGNIVGVNPGDEIVSTSDSQSDKLFLNTGLSLERTQQALVHERCFGADSIDLGFPDYNFKAAKPCAGTESLAAKNGLNQLIIPFLYAGMPNLGFYTKPDGPVENWAELLPDGKIEEALAAQEAAVDYAVHDMVYIAEKMYKIGMDGINMDTAGASGDADFLAALKACEAIRTKFPDMGVEMGMAGEYVLGMHGKLTYDGVRLAGLYPHKQVALAEKAGATIFGAVVNTNSNKSFAWNIARSCTFIKECSNVSNIPVHVNVGMGVGGIPMCEYLPSDVASRADKALVEICKIDGL